MATERVPFSQEVLLRMDATSTSPSAAALVVDVTVIPAAAAAGWFCLLSRHADATEHGASGGLREAPSLKL